MSGIFENYVILTDLDGTVFDDKVHVLPKDINAIRYFTKNGGLFGVSTGRIMVSALPLVRQLPVNAPCVFGNGGIILDTCNNEYIDRSFLPASAREALKKIMSQFPNLRAAVLYADGFYNVTEFNDGLKPFSLDVPETITAELDDLPDGWYKVLMNIMDTPMDEVDVYCKSLGYSDLRFMPSTSFYYEMLPFQSTKANGNRRLMNLMGWQDKTLVAIGDYYNDLEMIQEADIGVAVAAAPKEVQEAADFVVCDVHSGAIADLISRLEQMKKEDVSHSCQTGLR